MQAPRRSDDGYTRFWRSIGFVPPTVLVQAVLSSQHMDLTDREIGTLIHASSDDTIISDLRNNVSAVRRHQKLTPRPCDSGQLSVLNANDPLYAESGVASSRIVAGGALALGVASRRKSLMPNVFVSTTGDGRILPTDPGRNSSLLKLLFSGVAGALVGQTVAAVLGKQMSDQIIAREDMLGRLQSRLLVKRREMLETP